MLEIAFDGDHSYNTATYWILVGSMVSGVPVISANIILGAKKAVSGTLISRFTAILDPFSAGASDAISAAQGREFTVLRENARQVGVARVATLEAAALNQQRNQLNQQFLKGSGDELAKNTGTAQDIANQESKQQSSTPARNRAEEKSLPKPGGSKP